MPDGHKLRNKFLVDQRNVFDNKGLDTVLVESLKGVNCFRTLSLGGLSETATSRTMSCIHHSCLTCASIGATCTNMPWLLRVVSDGEASEFICFDGGRQDLHALSVVDGAITSLQALEIALVQARKVQIHL